MSRFAAALVLASSLAAITGCGRHPSETPAPSVGVWYRGDPAGVPRLDDLAVMRALDFSSVTWPASSTDHLSELRRLAGQVGLAVITRDSPSRLTASSALAPDGVVDVAVGAQPPEAILSLVWRAIAHGARAVAFDPGTASGSDLANVNGEVPAWIAPAKAVARQITFNAGLIAALRPGPAVAIDAPRPAGLDVVLLEVDRSWLVVATSAAASPLKATVHLPAAVPYALWVSMLDGENMSMLNETAGPRWSLELPPYGAAVYLIDKTLK